LEDLSEISESGARCGHFQPLKIGLVFFVLLTTVWTIVCTCFDHMLEHLRHHQMVLCLFCWLLELPFVCSSRLASWLHCSCSVNAGILLVVSPTCHGAWKRFGQTLLSGRFLFVFVIVCQRIKTKCKKFICVLGTVHATARAPAILSFSVEQHTTQPASCIVAMENLFEHKRIDNRNQTSVLRPKEEKN